MIGLPALLMMFRLYKARRFGGGVQRSLLSGVQLLLDVVLIDHIYATGVSFVSVLPFFGEPGERDGAATFWSTLPAPFPAWNYVDGVQVGDPAGIYANVGPGFSSITDRELPNYAIAQSRYLAALYYTTWNMLCVGMGDCKGITNSERVLTCVIMITGGFILSYTAGMGTGTVQFVNQKMEGLAARSRDLTQWVNCKDIDPDLVDRMVASAEVSEDDPTNGLSDCLDDAPPRLKKEAMAYIAGQATRTSRVFKDIHDVSPDSLWDVLAACKTTRIPADQPLFRQGDPAEQIAFILQGVVNYVRSGEGGQRYVIGSASSGEAVGLSTGLKGESQAANAVVCSPSLLCLVIDSAAFKEAFEKMPEKGREMVQRYADEEARGMDGAVADLKELAGDGTAATTDAQPKVATNLVIHEGKLNEVTSLPGGKDFFVVSLEPKQKKERMRLRLTSHFPLYGNLVSDYIGLRSHPEGPDNDVESDSTLHSRGILHPNGSIKTALNMTMGLAVIYTCITVPLYIGFDIPTTASVDGFDNFINALFFLDIFLTFRTAIPCEPDAGDGRVNTDPWEIFCKYVTGGLLMDLISTLPFDAMAGSGAAKLARVIRLIRLTRLLRLARLAKLDRLAPALNKFIVRYPREFFFISAIVQMVFLMHLLACAFVFVVNTVSNDNRPWWGAYIYGPDGNMYMVPEHNVPMIDLGTRYLAAFYWAASTATTTGVGDVAPSYDWERAFNSLAIVIGVIFYAYIAGLVAGMATQGVGAAVKGTLSKGDFAARASKLPQSVRRRLNAYHRTRLAYATPFDEGDIVGAFPFTLKKDVVLCLNEDSPVPAALTGKAWKGGCSASFNDRQFIFEVVSAAQPRWADEGEVIASGGDGVDEVFVVEEGAAVSEKKTKKSYIVSEERQYVVLGLGQAAEEAPAWKENVVVKTHCLYWAIPMATVKELAEKYPEVAEAIKIGRTH